MYLQTTAANEHFITHITAIWMLPGMYTLMYLQTTFVPEHFITHITAIWMLPGMYTLMYLQTTRVPVCLITHTTAICTFNSMCPLLKERKGVSLLFKKAVTNIMKCKLHISYMYITRLVL